jgi:alpha-tubulin suppressor-like RCC1 family protein
VQAENITAIAAGVQFALALSSSGRVYAWGGDGYGTISDLPASTQSGVKRIMASKYVGMAIDSDDGLVAWSFLFFFQIGLDRDAGVPSSLRSGLRDAGAGNFYTAALTLGAGNTGAVVVQGTNNDRGQLDVPAELSSGVSAIAVSESHGLALKAGRVYAWGGVGPAATPGMVNVPASAQSNIVAIAASEFGSIALSSSGSVIAWGDFMLAEVPERAQNGVASIAAGAGHAVAVKTDGTLVAWGLYDDGVQIPDEYA